MENLDIVTMNLKKLRESRGLMQGEIAFKLGVRAMTYSRYENGITEIPVGMLTPIARVFQISVSELLEIIAENQNG